MSEATAQRTETDPPPTAEVLVAGAGIAGLLAAWRFARRGAEVVVLDDPRRPPASAVAAGMIAPVGEASWGEERSHEAALWSAAAWPGLAGELEAESGREVPLRRCGALHVALDRDEAAELTRLEALHGRLGLESRRLRPSEARKLEPGLATAISAALEAPGEAEVDPRALLAALAGAASRAGATFATARVEALAEGKARLAGGGGIEAARIVLATGAWMQGWADAATVPVRPVRGELIRLEADPARMPCARIVRGESFYVVPRRGGEVVVGATSQERGFDVGVQAGAVLELLREAQRALPDLGELRFAEVAAGLRPATPDNAPVLEAGADGAPTLIAGLYRHGVLLAPLVAAFADSVAAGEAPPGVVAGLGLDRFGREGELAGAGA